MPRQTSPPRNHPSATERLNVLRKNIRKEQDLGRCIVVDRAVAKFWPELFLSPFGVVDKGNSDPDVAGRVIHDLSFPEGASVNDHTDAESVPTAEYTHCAAIAREILAQKERFPGRSIKILLGDVAAAFRNLSTHSQSAHLFAGTIPEDDALIIDLSACFGWTGSPGFYGVIGDAIAHIHGTTSNTYYPNGFFNHHWVDDHVCIAADVGSNCTDVEQSLRSAMTLILGPDAVNDDKFTPWATSQKILGLVFDTIAGTISIPADKIVKARALVTDAYNSRALSRKRYRSLLGSLRHVATCVRPAKAFLQRLRAAESKLHRWTSVPMTPHMREDLAWWRVILTSPTLNGVPLEYFRHNPPCDLTIEMDASDTGLCALDRAHRRVLTYRFSETEQNLIRVFNTDACNEFDINYRELLSCAFAVHAWAPAWRVKNMETPHTTPTHVHFRIDNTSAVAWQNKMSSSNTRAQTIIRLLSYWEMHYGLRFSSSHIPGADNAIADAGSRQSKDHHSAHNRHQWSGADLARYLREHSVADSTYRKYERAFGTWQAFITRRGVNPWLSGVPAVAQIQHVSDFILMGFQQGYGSGRPVRSAAIANNLMGVRHFFQASGRHFPVDHPQVRMLLKGISRLDSPPERKAPVSIQLMEACFASLNLASFSDQALWGFCVWRSFSCFGGRR